MELGVAEARAEALAVRQGVPAPYHFSDAGPPPDAQPSVSVIRDPRMIIGGIQNKVLNPIAGLANQSVIPPSG